ncbi:MAG: lipopolysaccharide kinase InaA family protein [Planctomycetota bacterium]
MQQDERIIETAAEQLVSLLAGLHRDGSFVRDPSPSVLGRDENGRLFIADADLESRSNRDAPDDTLGQLWALMRGESPRVKIAAARDYAARRGLGDLDLDRLLREFRLRDIERCFHENRDFKVLESGGLVWHCRRELLREEHLPVLEDPDRWLEPGDHLVKDGRSTTIGRTAGEALMKRFNLKKYRSLVTNQLAGSRARIAFQQAYHLETMGVRTARAIAFAERTKLGCIYRSYLLLDWLADVQPGALAFQEWNGSRPELKRRVLEDAGRMIGRLHDAGFSNRDLKSNNLLVNEAGQVWVIDLDGVAHEGRVPEEQRLKNLLRIVRDLPRYGHLSTREALTFLHSYTRAVRQGNTRDLYRKLAAEPIA